MWAVFLRAGTGCVCVCGVMGVYSKKVHSAADLCWLRP